MNYYVATNVMVRSRLYDLNCPPKYHFAIIALRKERGRLAAQRKSPVFFYITEIE